MKHIFLISLFTLGLAGSTQANDFDDVGPEVLFYDFYGSDHDMDHRGHIHTVMSNGIMYVKDMMNDDTYMHNDVVPQALQEPF